IFAERMPRIADDEARNAHADIDERGRNACAKKIKMRKTEFTVDQEISQHEIRRNGGKRDPERGLGPVDRAHESAERDDPPPGLDATVEGGQIAFGAAPLPRRGPKSDEDAAPMELHRREGKAEKQGRT